jgi:uncharacterized protein (DUF1015 family)
VADAQPFRALHYDLDMTGGLDPVTSPPYDVIDPAQREALASRSPWNVVRIDLPEPAEPGGDPYAEAARILDSWKAEGAVVQDAEPALWALTQDYTGPDGQARTRTGFFAAVRIEDYGPGKIRPHERTHPGPKEDRLRLTRATKANLSPIFSLYSDPDGFATAALGRATEADPWAAQTDDDGTVHRLWRLPADGAAPILQEVLGGSELLIADGHHRYETARVYAEEVGGEGPQRYVLMNLVALEDPGLTVFPTHRLVSGLLDDPARSEALGAEIERCFEVTELDSEADLPPDGTAPDGRLQFGYLDAAERCPLRLVLRDQAIADEALAGFPEPYRRLDTAVLEALILCGPLGLTEDDISHLNGLGYSRSDDEALAMVGNGFDAAFFLSGVPVAQIREIAAAGVNMPPKSTFFTPKVPTGLLFHALA